jgi:hypothetical protein
LSSITGVTADGGKAGVAARGTVERRNADEAVNALLRLQPAIGAVALDLERGRFDARLFALALVHLLDLHAVFLGPAHIHAPQHRGPVLALGSAFAGIDLDIGIIAVGLAREERSEFGFFGTVSGAFQGSFKVGNHVVVAFGELKQLTGVFGFFFERLNGFNPFGQLLTLSHHGLRGLRIVPEVRLLRESGQFVEAFCGCIPVKDASVAERPKSGSGRSGT